MARVEKGQGSILNMTVSFLCNNDENIVKRF